MIIEINADLSATVYDYSGKRGFRLPTYNPRTMAKFANEDEVHECAMSFIGEDIMVDFDEAEWHSSAFETPVAEPTPVDPAPVDPAPVDPAPVDPAPVEEAPAADPAPVDPAPAAE